jgi:hypothetical protein
MKYKEQSLNKLEQISSAISSTEFLISRGDQNGSLQSIENLREKLEELRGMISLEDDTFETYGR